MTDAEKRQQKAMLLLDYEDATSNLAHLEEKAASLSGKLGAVAEWLRYTSERNTPLRDEIYSVSGKLGAVAEWLRYTSERNTPLRDEIYSVSGKLGAVAEWLRYASERNTPLRDEIYSVKAAGKVNILADSKIPVAMDFKMVTQLVREIGDARTLVADLQKRKESLGLK